ncbi:MAG: cysteine synthase family protein [DPANN group archaeon]|nr:cysteine synthase family protein [DPANN group archaeon]
MVKTDMLGEIGKTPLVRINKLAKGISSTVLAKLEYFNPTGSIKDRMAQFMVKDAEERGLLRPGGTIVENTSGNTGAGLALVAAIRGYRAVFTIPDKMSQEKIDFLRAFGAEVIVCPTDVAPEDPQSYYSVARRIAKERNAFYPDQYNNPKNIEAHYRTTGPEIWEQTDGNVDVLIAGMGTGGTLTGTGRYLKEKNPDLKIVAVDPYGSVFHDYWRYRKRSSPQVYRLEGIGEDHIVKCVDFGLIDEMIQVNDQESFLAARRLAREEGIFAGGSSGAAMSAALRYLKDRSDLTAVIIFPDSGFKYLSKIFNDRWMEREGFL